MKDSHNVTTTRGYLEVHTTKAHHS